MPNLEQTEMAVVAMRSFVWTLLFLGAAGAAPLQDKVASVVALPLTPGAVALLADAVGDARAQQRLTEALASADPNVRAVAARLAVSTRSVAQVPALRRAVATETDLVAAVEIVRALAIFLGPAADPIILPHVERMGSGAALSLAEILVRSRPEAAGAVLAQLGTQPALHRSLGQLVALGMRQNPAHVGALREALVTLNTEAAWAGCFEGFIERWQAVPDVVLLAGLRSKTREIRSASVWTVARYRLAQLPVSAAVTKEALPGEADAHAPESWEAFGRELVARGTGQRPTSMTWPDLIRANRLAAEARASSAGSPLLTSDERRALEEFNPTKSAVRASVPDARGRTLSDEPGRLLTMGWMVPGLASDLMRLTSCTPRKEQRFVLTGLVFATDPSLTKGAMQSGDLSPECVRAARVALMLAVAPHDAVVSPATHEPVLIVFDREALSCTDAHSADRRRIATGPQRVGGAIKPPTKTHNISPSYPLTAQREGIQGVVVLGATISSAGCVIEAETMRGVDPRLDYAAMDAVLGWRYTPTLVDGAAVPVRMTVTVSFTLQKP